MESKRVWVRRIVNGRPKFVRSVVNYKRLAKKDPQKK